MIEIWYEKEDQFCILSFFQFFNEGGERTYFNTVDSISYEEYKLSELLGTKLLAFDVYRGSVIVLDGGIIVSLPA